MRSGRIPPRICTTRPSLYGFPQAIQCPSACNARIVLCVLAQTHAGPRGGGYPNVSGPSLRGLRFRAPVPLAGSIHSHSDAASFADESSLLFLPCCVREYRLAGFVNILRPEKILIGFLLGRYLAMDVSLGNDTDGLGLGLGTGSPYVREARKARDGGLMVFFQLEVHDQCSISKTV